MLDGHVDRSANSEHYHIQPAHLIRKQEEDLRCLSSNAGMWQNNRTGITVLPTWLLLLLALFLLALVPRAIQSAPSLTSMGGALDTDAMDGQSRGHGNGSLDSLSLVIIVSAMDGAAATATDRGGRITSNQHQRFYPNFRWQLRSLAANPVPCSAVCCHRPRLPFPLLPCCCSWSLPPRPWTPCQTTHGSSRVRLLAVSTLFVIFCNKLNHVLILKLTKLLIRRHQIFINVGFKNEKDLKSWIWWPATRILDRRLCPFGCRCNGGNDAKWKVSKVNIPAQTSNDKNLMITKHLCKSPTGRHPCSSGAWHDKMDAESRFFGGQWRRSALLWRPLTRRHSAFFFCLLLQLPLKLIEVSNAVAGL